MEGFAKKAILLVFVLGILGFFLSGGDVLGEGPLFEDSNILIIEIEEEIKISIIPPFARLVIGERMEFRASVGGGVFTNEEGIVAYFVTPQEGQILQQGESIWVAVGISHPDNIEITRVEFFRDENKIGEANEGNAAGHWGIMWKPDSIGNYSLKATVRYRKLQ